ncbi:MAG: TIGR03862 family flavoprotein, partial [Desulfobulbaceae bacterium]|nr:TIGR03862 family flavoprotein [Desulfobulbaceae bacterium]HIJ80024.1 TIGR03862 family flavoprotein [Deltaproteobacteria bacterium]
QPWFAKILDRFSPADLRRWLKEMGIETQIGSSGRVFPATATAADLLRAWLARLKRAGVVFHTGHRWLDLTPEGKLLFRRADQEELWVAPAATVLALGGASWPKTGSDGSWTSILARHGVKIAPFVPSNCGFEAAWSETMVNRFAGAPLKNLLLTTSGGQQQVGELVITGYGVEGGGIYPLSKPLREELAATGRAVLFLDLKRDLDEEEVRTRLARPRGKNSLANFLRKQLRLDGPAYSLLRECCPAEDFNDPSRLAARIKRLPLVFTGIRPLAEAISSAGGIAMDEVDGVGMLIRLPGVFAAGEMLGWEAPTGGFLLQAAFSTGYCAAQGLLAWLKSGRVCGQGANLQLISNSGA